MLATHAGPSGRTLRSWVFVRGVGRRPRQRPAAHPRSPTDDALYIATHTGLWRGVADSQRARRVGDTRHDVMGFTVAGPDHFLGSGHPDARQDLPPLLGLVESRDDGRSWQPTSLLGEADFHVLPCRDGRIYGFDATNGRLMASADDGRAWRQLGAPGALLDLAGSRWPDRLARRR